MVKYIFSVTMLNFINRQGNNTEAWLWLYYLCTDKIWEMKNFHVFFDFWFWNLIQCNTWNKNMKGIRTNRFVILHYFSSHSKYRDKLFIAENSFWTRIFLSFSKMLFDMFVTKLHRLKWKQKKKAEILLSKRYSGMSIFYFKYTIKYIYKWASFLDRQEIFRKIKEQKNDSICFFTFASEFCFRAKRDQY